MSDEISRLFQEELEQLEQFKSRCSDEQYQGNALMVHYADIARIFEKTFAP